MPINIKLNQNEAMSSSYGRYYLEAATSEVLSTEGLVNHITHHNCAVGTEAIAAVIRKLGECIPELVAQGQPVKIDGLGIFYPTAENKKNGLLKSQLLDSKVNPLDALEGIHLRFRPQSDDLNDLTSKSFLKLQVQPVINLVCRAKAVDLTPEVTDKSKKKWASQKCTLAEYRNAGGFPSMGSLTPDPSPTGEGSQSGSGSSNTNGSNGTNSGSENSGSQSQQNSVAAPTISGVNPFEETTQVSISGPDGATIYYSENGDDPDSNDTLYTQPFTIDETTTIKAIAIKDGVSSQVTTKVFTKGTGGSGGFETGA